MTISIKLSVVGIAFKLWSLMLRITEWTTQWPSPGDWYMATSSFWYTRIIEGSNFSCLKKTKLTWYVYHM